jgi:hypothetical protein
MSSPKMHKIQMAASLFELVDLLENKTMVGILNRTDIPEAYKYIERQIVYNYNIDIYQLDETYICNVRHLGLFQVL